MKKDRQLWADLRFDYYVSGRQLCFNGTFRPAYLMLSYAIEAGFKALISEFKSNEIQGSYTRKIKNSHDLVEIYKFMSSHGIATNIEVSQDFLTYVTNAFNRYPTQMKKSNLMWQAFFVDYIRYFDDLMYQIDVAIYKKTNDIQSLIISKACLDIECVNSAIYFHENFAALLSLDNVLDEIESNFPKRIEKVRELCCVEKIQKLDSLGSGLSMGFPWSSILEKAETGRAKNFRLPYVVDNIMTWNN